jgi:hypothetical protein
MLCMQVLNLYLSKIVRVYSMCKFWVHIYASFKLYLDKMQVLNFEHSRTWLLAIMDHQFASVDKFICWQFWTSACFSQQFCIDIWHQSTIRLKFTNQNTISWHCQHIINHNSKHHQFTITLIFTNQTTHQYILQKSVPSSDFTKYICPHNKFN